MRIKNLLKSDVVKVGAGIAVGAAAAYFAPQIGAAATDARKNVQAYRSKLFPSHGTQNESTKAGEKEAASSQRVYATGAAPIAGQRSQGGSFIEAIAAAIASLFGGRRTA